MAAHRYWRVRSPDTWIGGDYMGCAELELASAFGGADLTTGKTATASAVLGSNPTSNALDNNPATLWTTGGSVPPAGGHWLAVDLGPGGDADVAEVRYTARPDGYREDPVRLILEWSDDGVAWTVLFDLNGLAAWGAGETRVIRWDGTTAYVFSGIRVHQQYAYALANGLAALQVHQQYAYVLSQPPPSIPFTGTSTDWRLNLPASTNGSYAALAEIQMHDSPGGPQLCAGGLASSSSNYSGNYTPDKAFDGALNTLWHSGAGLPAWIGYSFPAAVAVLELYLWARGDSENGVAPTTIQLQYSMDGGSTWTTYASISGEPAWTTGEQRIYHVEGNALVRGGAAGAAQPKRAAQIIG